MHYVYVHLFNFRYPSPQPVFQFLIQHIFTEELLCARHWAGCDGSVSYVFSTEDSAWTTGGAP